VKWVEIDATANILPTGVGGGRSQRSRVISPLIAPGHNEPLGAFP